MTINTLQSTLANHIDATQALHQLHTQTLPELNSNITSQLIAQVPAEFKTLEDFSARYRNDRYGRFSPSVINAIRDMANKYGVNPVALAYIAYVESTGNPNAKPNSTGSTGLMQVKLPTFNKHVPGGSIYNPRDNIEAALLELIHDTAPILGKYGINLNSLTIGELYVLHQQGSASGPAIIAAARGNSITVPRQGKAALTIPHDAPIPHIAAGGVNIVRYSYAPHNIESPKQANARISRNIPGNATHPDGSAFPKNGFHITAKDYVSMWSNRLGPLGSSSFFTPGAAFR